MMGEIVKWSINAVTILLLIFASWRAINNKNNLVLGLVIFGNLIVYYFTLSPLLCWIVSVVCIILAGRAKFEIEKDSSINIGSKKDIKLQNYSSISIEGNKKMVKPGQIIGLLIGAGLILFPIVGFVTNEASMLDSKGKMIGIGFIVFGAFMVLVNIIGMVKGTDDLLATNETVVASPVQSRASVEVPEVVVGNKVRCRFCKKLYSAEYNGCPHCKRK